MKESNKVMIDLFFTNVTKLQIIKIKFCILTTSKTKHEVK